MHPGERGSAPVEFVLVGVLLTALFLGVLQLGIDLHIRNVLVASAAEGARYGANADREPGDGAARARQLIVVAAGGRYAREVSAGVGDDGGVPVVDVRVAAELPVVLGWLPAARIVVHGHALMEPR